MDERIDKVRAWLLSAAEKLVDSPDAVSEWRKASIKVVSAAMIAYSLTAPTEADEAEDHLVTLVRGRSDGDK